jgi:lactoylglutathione lyase
LIKRIANVAVYVEDQQAATIFWTEKVGFELIRKDEMFPGSYWIEVAPKGAESSLVIYPKEVMNDWEQRKPSIVFESDDIHKLYETLKTNGVQIHGEPEKMKWGTFIQFNDNEGNEFVVKG